MDSVKMLLHRMELNRPMATMLHSAMDPCPAITTASSATATSAKSPIARPGLPLANMATMMFATISSAMGHRSPMDTGPVALSTMSRTNIAAPIAAMMPGLRPGAIALSSATAPMKRPAMAPPQ